MNFLAVLRGITLVTASWVLASCASPRAPLIGLIYSDTTSGVAVSSNQAGNRVGEACSTGVLGLVAMGDASVEAARRNGGITLITSVDQKIENLLVYQRYCTIVRGR